MIGIKLESGEFLTLPPSSSIRMTLTSSLFFDEEGGYSFPFTIPIEGNAQKLGFPEALMLRTSVKKFNVNLCLFSNVWREAILTIRNIVGKDYVCNVSVEGSILSQIVANKKLQELSYGGDRAIRPYTYARYQLNGSGTTGNVTMGFIDPGSFVKTVAFNSTRQQTLTDMAAAINADPARLNANIVSAEASGTEITIYSLITHRPPNPHAAGVNFTAGTGRTFFRVNNDMILEVLNHMDAVAAGSYPDYDYAFFPLNNPSFYGDAKPEYLGYVNYHNGTQFNANQSGGVSGIGFVSPVTPFPYLLSVLKYIMEENNLKMTGSFVEDSEIKKVVIYNNYSIDRRANYGALGSSDHQGINITTGTIRIGDHLPVMTIGEFIKAVKSRWALAFFYYNERRQAVIKTKNEILADTKYEDWTSIAEPSTDEEYIEVADGYTIAPKQDDSDSAIEIKDLSLETVLSPVNNVSDLPVTLDSINTVRLVLSLNHYYKSSYTLVGSTVTVVWAFHCQNLGDYVVGAGKQEVPLASGAIDIRKHTAVSGLDKKWLVPYADQEGSSPEYELGINSFSLRFLFYRGLQPGFGAADVAITYPMATSYTKNYNDTVIGTRTLIPEDAYADHQNWLAFMETTRPVKFNLRLTPEQLINLDYSVKKRINGVNYFLAKIDIVTTMRGLKIATGLFYKIT